VPDATHRAMSDRSAFQLANVTKTPPQYGAITPRWLVRLLDWKPLEAGTLRVNRVIEDSAPDVICGQKDEKALPDSYIDYDPKPHEYTLCGINSVVNVHTRVSDLYSNPFDQIREQLRLSIENVKEN
jgi:Phage capsid-like protein